MIFMSHFVGQHAGTPQLVVCHAMSVEDRIVTLGYPPHVASLMRTTTAAVK